MNTHAFPFSRLAATLLLLSVPASLLPAAPELILSFDGAANSPVADRVSGDSAALRNVRRVEGRFGQALYFTGADSSLSLPAGEKASPTGTLSLWVKPDADAPADGLLWARSAGGVHYANNRLSIEYDAARRRVRCESRWGGEPYPYAWSVVSPDDSVPPGRWTMLTLVQDGKGVRLYLDGEPAPMQAQGRRPLTWTDAASANPWMLKSWLAGSAARTGAGFRGAIDEVIADNRALSATEVRALLKNEYTGEEAVAASFRPRLSLLGDWAFAFTPPGGDTSQPPAAGAWQPITVGTDAWKHSWRGYKIDWHGADRDAIRSVWYRKTVRLPAAMFRGRRVMLRFEAVAFACDVFVNGKKIGANDDGFLPFECDATDAARLDADNEILLRVGSSQEAYAKGWPIGAMHNYEGGIAGACWVESKPAFSIDDVFLNPSVRRGVLAVQAALSRPASGARLAWRIFDGERVVKEGRCPADARVAGDTVSWDITWADAVRWSPETPHLYRFVLSLDSPGGEPDRVARTFGFREVWLDGPDLYLNGKKIRLYARWGHVGEFFYASDARGRSLPPDELWKAARSVGLNAMRLHGQPYPHEFLDAADRQGFLIIDETALFHRPGTEQALDHVRRFVRRDRDHPSVVLWSGSNEFEHWKVPRNPKATAFLVKVRAAIKQLDPSRPVYESAYGETDGHEDALSVHYPEGSAAQRWPNLLFWPDNPAISPTNNVAGTLRPWDRSKPLMIGEHLLRPAQVGPLIGPGFFRLSDAEVRRESGRWYSEAVILYRMQDLLMFGQPILTVNGRKRIDTERDVEIAKRGFAPVAFTLYPWTDHWFSDETARYELWLSNDRLDAFKGTFTVTLRLDERELFSRQIPVQAAQGGTARVPVALPLSGAAGASPAQVELSVSLRGDDGGAAAPILTRTLSVFPRSAPPPTHERAVFVYDTGQDVPALAARLRGRSLHDPAALAALPPSKSVLVIPPGVTPSVQSALGKPLERFVRNGGRVLVLSQDAYAPGWLPFDARLSSAPSNVLYPTSDAHPLLAGLPPRALCFWRPDHAVVRSALEGLDGATVRVLADYPVNGLAEVLHGGGLYLLSQVEIGSALAVEPMAGVLLDRMVAYLDTAPADPAKTTALVARPGAPYPRALDGLGAAFAHHWTSPPPAAELARIDQIIWDASSMAPTDDTWTLLAPWVRSGERLVLHGLDRAGIQKLSAWTGLALSPATLRGLPALLPDPLNRGIGYATIPFLDEKGAPAFPAIEAGAGVQAATQPLLWGALPCGRGEIVIDQSRWEAETQKVETASRFATALLANLGVRFAGLPLVTAGSAWRPLDLRDAFDAGIKTAYDATYPDHQNIDAGLLLRGDWPRGRVTLGGVLFDIADPDTMPGGKNLIRINSRNTAPGGAAVESFPGGPQNVTIAVPRVNASQLAFLHSALHLWGPVFGQFGDKRLLWEYEIDYESGRRLRVPVILGRQSGALRDGTIAGQPEAKLAIDSADATGERTAYYGMLWRNPHPEDKITAIRVLGTDNPARMPVVLAVSYQPYDQAFE